MKSFKRILSAIIACVMLMAVAVPFAAFADGPVVEVSGGGANGKPGDEVACNISINGAKIGAVQLTVTFDAAVLEYQRVEIGDDIRDLPEDNPAVYLANDNDAATGKLILGAAITKGVEFDVAALSIIFTIRNVEESTHSIINIQVDRLRDEEDNALEFTANGGSVTVTVLHIESIVFADESKELEVGQEFVPEYTVNPEGYTDAFNPVWSSDNAEIASVDENGKITALREGTANITIANGEISATLPVTVKPAGVPIESIVFADESKELEVGAEYTPAYTVNPEGYTDPFEPVWVSSNVDVAVVDENGKITAVGEGEATITVSCGEISATLPITVVAPAQQYKKGDMDKDGEITVADALRALRIAAKLVEPTEEDLLIGNVDGDNEITVADALKILRVAAKLAEEDSLQ
ncbi:MAG: Ig-like domain-containing protein [Clostridia bacterium]|nr:Ig-like domain-containing protein [Clostridia bacterium]MBR5769669.1 Ig-like domain-containing protein [Clostridia bacterium]